MSTGSTDPAPVAKKLLSAGKRPSKPSSSASAHPPPSPVHADPPPPVPRPAVPEKAPETGASPQAASAPAPVQKSTAKAPAKAVTPARKSVAAPSKKAASAPSVKRVPNPDSPKSKKPPLSKVAIDRNKARHRREHLGIREDSWIASAIFRIFSNQYANDAKMCAERGVSRFSIEKKTVEKMARLVKNAFEKICHAYNNNISMWNKTSLELRMASGSWRLSMSDELGDYAHAFARPVMQKMITQSEEAKKAKAL